MVSMVTMVSLRRLISLLWRVLRYLGLGVLIVPLAGMTLAWFGVNVWTVAAVVVALAVALARPAVAAGLLPAAMIGTGTCGLVKAAVPATRTAYMWIATAPHQARFTLSPIPGGRAGQPQPFTGKYSWTRIAVPAGYLREAVIPRILHGAHFSRPVAAVFELGRPAVGSASLWWGRALVTFSLLLLAIGLWLTPRVLGRLRGHTAKVAPYLLRRIRENYW